MDNKMILNGKLIEVSESLDGDSSRKTAKFLLCYLDKKNENGVGIKESDLSDEELNTLIGQPLVAKLLYDESTKSYNFGGHEVKTIYTLDNSGHLIKSNNFEQTSPLGYHTDVSIQDIDTPDGIKRGIIGTVCLWTRYQKAMSVIEKLGDKLKTSWEISYSGTYSEDGVDWRTGITFLANCCLGTNIAPAYSEAGLLEVAEKEQDELSQAFMEDIIEISESQNNKIDADKSSVENKINDNKGGHIKMAKENKTELSSLTMDDLYTKVRKAINIATDEDKWYYITYLYPIEFRAIAHSYDDDDMVFVEFTYSVSENGDVSITGKNNVEMVFKPKVDVDTEMSEINAKLSTKENELSQKVDEIVKLGETIQSLNSAIAEKNLEISELEPVKAELAEKKAKEEEEAKCKKKAELSEMMVSSKYFTSEELSSNNEIANALENLDEATLKTMIADKVIESAEKAKEEAEKKKCKAEKEVEKSSIEVSEAKTDLNAEQNYDYVNPVKSLFKNGFFNK